MAAYTNSLLPAICFSFDSLLHLKAKTKLDVDWYRQEFDIPQTASTQQTLHLLASEQLSSPKMRGTTPSPILMLSYSLAISMISQPWRVKHCALFVTMVHHQSPHLAAKTFFSGYAKLDQALEYVEALLPEQEVIQGVRRVTLRMFSHMALRELMANMLIHQVFLLPVPDL